MRTAPFPPPTLLNGRDEQRRPAATTPTRPSRAARRAGYVAAATANLIGLWIIANVLDWGWPPFLTEELDDLMGLITVSILLTVAANALWFWHDPDRLRRPVQVVLNAVSLVVVVRTWQVFPFDFTDYAGWWEATTRVVLALGALGLVADTITQLAALARDRTAPAGDR